MLAPVRAELLSIQCMSCRRNRVTRPSTRLPSTQALQERVEVGPVVRIAAAHCLAFVIQPLGLVGLARMLNAPSEAPVL
eukprot:6463515-Amphidinium_carterae.1